ncbi:MAG: isochorismatase family protein [Kouleothrix sp.]
MQCRPASQRACGPYRPAGGRAVHTGVCAGCARPGLTQDTHDPATPEFQAYPPHCLRGTPESEAVDALKALPFYDEVAIFPKNSINSHLGTGLGVMGRKVHPLVNTFIVVGDCSDLCTYQAAMQLRLEANAGNLARRVINPAAAVDTFDTPVSVARDLGIYAHDGDLHYALFLHHIWLRTASKL